MTNAQEKEVLNKLNLKNFRHVSKNLVMQLSSSFDKLSDDVKIKILEQIPDFTGKAIEAVKSLGDVFTRNADSDDTAIRESCKVQEQRMSILREELHRDDLDGRERLHIIDDIKDAANQIPEMAREFHKDREQDLKTIATVCMMLVMVTGAMVGVSIRKR